MIKKSTLKSLSLGVTALALSAIAAQASPQRFAYSYEASVLPKGGFEFETGITWAHHSGEDGFAFAHELEYGITDKLQISAILAEWEAVHVKGEGTDSAYGASGFELIYNLSNPNTDIVGASILGEVLMSDKHFSLETIGILQKNFGAVSVVYNAKFEAAWDGDSLSDLNERGGELTQSLAVGYNVNAGLTVGVEAFDVIGFEDWKDSTPNALFVGPSISYRGSHAWIALAAGWQVTDVEDEADLSVRAKIGFVW